MTGPSVRYSNALDGVTPEALAGGFFEGWTALPSCDEHLRLLSAASHRIVAIDEDKVVGFVTALSDGVFSAYIPLLEVLPSYRGRGIGTELVRRLLVEIGNLYMVDVMCDPDVYPFYEPFGFRPSTGGIIRNFDWQSRGA